YSMMIFEFSIYIITYYFFFDYHLVQPLRTTLFPYTTLFRSPDDSLATVVKREMNPRLFQNAVEKVLRKLPQLTVIKGEEVLSIHQRKRNWEVQASSKHKYVVRCVIDASREQELSHLIDISWDNHREQMQPLGTLSLAKMRTLVAAG